MLYSCQVRRRRHCFTDFRKNGLWLKGLEAADKFKRSGYTISDV